MKKYTINDLLEVCSESTYDNIINSNQLITESYVISHDNYQINLDKWKPGTPLWITGTSGDGKSTLAFNLAKKQNALIVPTDLVLCRLKWSKEKFESKLKTSDLFNNPLYSIGSDFIRNKISWPYEIMSNYDTMSSNPDTAKYYQEYFDWVIQQNQVNPKYKSKKVIIEGCDICFATDPEYMANQPLIIIGVSRLKASLNRIHRDRIDDGHTMIDSISRELKRQKYIKKLDADKDTFLKNVKKYR